MWFTPSSTARRSTAIDPVAVARRAGWKAALPVSRIAPKPIRLTVRSPSVQVPAAAAVIVSEVIAGVSHAPGTAPAGFYGWMYVLSVATADAGLPTGNGSGTPEDALDTACRLHLTGLGT